MQHAFKLRLWMLPTWAQYQPNTGKTSTLTLSRRLAALLSSGPPSNCHSAERRKHYMAAASTSRGMFILFEGVDRCGKTTQTRKLVAALEAAGKKVRMMRFPDRTAPTGQLISRYLTGDAELPDQAVHLIFAANRWEARSSMLADLAAGVHIVCDRYAYSGVAYSAAKKMFDIEWAKSPDIGMPMPDVVLYMELSPDAAKSRAEYGQERYEVPEFQREVKAMFDVLATEVSAVHPTLWRKVDASGTIEGVHDTIMGIVGEVEVTAATSPIKRLWDAAPLPLADEVPTAEMT